MTLECKHGHLARKCLTCDLEAELATEKARADRAEARLRAIGSAQSVHAPYDRLDTWECFWRDESRTNLLADTLESLADAIIERAGKEKA